MDMLSVKNIAFRYGERTVLNNISFDIAKGSLCGLLGPNGSGKSTLIRCCLNLLAYREGDIFVNGTNIKKIKPSALAKRIAYVPQEHRLSFSYTVKDIVLMGRSPHMRGVFGVTQEDHNIADEAIDMLGISHLADKSSNELSGGERQMTLIARAMAQQAQIIMLDEPTSALDFGNQIMIWKLLKKIAQSGVTIIACSHDPNHILWYSDEIVALSQGSMVAAGKTSEALDKELLSVLYNNEYAIDEIDGKKIIFPKNI